MEANDRICVAGGETVIGLAIENALRKRGYRNLVGLNGKSPEWTDKRAVDAFFRDFNPQWVFVAAGRSGGIEKNRQSPATLMLDNLLVASSIIPAAAIHGVRKLLYLASSCCYPKDCPQPMDVGQLGCGQLESTSASYATAKLAGITLCQAYRNQHGSPFICGIPADVYGPGGSFDDRNSHVIPALMRRMHEAKRANDSCITIWGTGTPRREFLFVDDLADASIFVMNHYDDIVPINLGGGVELSIREASKIISEIVGFNGEVKYDPSRPDGTPRKLLDSHVLHEMGWRPTTDFRTGLQETYRSFLQQ